MGNRISAIDRNGRKRNFVYDALNRQVEEQWLNDTDEVIRSSQSVYDAVGQLLQVSDPDSTVVTPKIRTGLRERKLESIGGIDHGK